MDAIPVVGTDVFFTLLHECLLHEQTPGELFTSVTLELDAHTMYDRTL
jgi:hypothetical protein